MTKKDLLPIIIQTITLLAGGIVYASGQEHRMTIMEEAIKSEQHIIEEQRITQDLIRAELQTTQLTVNRLVALEEFMHGLSADEKAALKGKR